MRDKSAREVKVKRINRERRVGMVNRNQAKIMDGNISQTFHQEHGFHGIRGSKVRR